VLGSFPPNLGALSATSVPDGIGTDTVIESGRGYWVEAVSSSALIVIFPAATCTFFSHVE
jgi:hypothetical protein